MVEVMRAALLATRDLLRPGMLFHALWPTVVAFLGWLVVAWNTWTPAKARLLEMFPADSWINSFSGFLADLVLLLSFLPFVYVTALLLLAGFALPRMMSIVADRDYPDLARAGVNPFLPSLANALLAGLVFIAGWLLTLTVIWVPGVLLIMPTIWLAWLNQRTFRFDALAEHASRSERYAVVRDNRTKLYSAGVLTALAAHVPIVNFLVPAWSGLLFVHLCLEQLRRTRKEGVVWDQQ